jgi:hypothetical protein
METKLRKVFECPCKHLPWSRLSKTTILRFKSIYQRDVHYIFIFVIPYIYCCQVRNSFPGCSASRTRVQSAISSSYDVILPCHQFVCKIHSPSRPLFLFFLIACSIFIMPLCALCLYSWGYCCFRFGFISGQIAPYLF